MIKYEDQFFVEQDEEQKRYIREFDLKTVGDQSLEDTLKISQNDIDQIAIIAKTEVQLENGIAISKLDRPHLIISEFKENPYDYYEREVNN